MTSESSGDSQTLTGSGSLAMLADNISIPAGQVPAFSTASEEASADGKAQVSGGACVAMLCNRDMARLLMLGDL